MPKKEPLYPHVPKSRRPAEKLPTMFKIISERTGEDSYGVFRETVYEQEGIYVKERYNDGRHAGYHAQTTFSVALEPHPVTWIAPFNTYEDAYHFYHVTRGQKPSPVCERAEALRKVPPRKTGRVQLLERYMLPEGGFVQVAKLGRNYTFTRGYSSFTQAPDVQLGLTKDEAMRRLADALRASVLEIEE